MFNQQPQKPVEGEPEDILNEVDPMALPKRPMQSPKIEPQFSQKPPSGIGPESNMAPSSNMARKLSPPLNLPTAAAPEAPKSANMGTKDIFSEIDLNPNKPGIPVGLQIKETRQDDEMIVSDVERKKPLLKSKIFVIVLLAVIFFGILGAAAYFIFKELNGPVGIDINENNAAVNENSDLANTPSADNPSENTNTEPSSSPVNNEPVATPTPLAVDSDYDGLNDVDERMYGTDSMKVDTDNDGLSDRDEVKVWLTDPLNPDSDGDGFMDGEEVQNKYNPLGPGKLTEIPNNN